MVFVDALLTEPPSTRRQIGLKLTLACKAFKAIIAKTDVFWTFIVIDPGSILTSTKNVIREKDRLDDVLRRSRRFPLDVFAIFPFSRGWCDAEDSASTKRWEMHCREYLDRLLMEQHRWRNVLIHTGYSCGAFPSIMCSATIHSAVRDVPTLENLAICAVSHDCFPHHQTGSGRFQALSLRSLELDAGPRINLPVDAEVVSICVPLLRELVAGDGVPLEFLCQCLKSCADSLHTLRWKHGYLYYSQCVPRSACLPGVKTLVLQNPILKTLALIRTPNLETLIIQSTYDFSLSYIKSLKAVSSVLCLDLGGVLISSSDLVMLIESLPKLRDLRCRTHYTDSRETCFDKLRQVVESRRGGEHPFLHLWCRDVGKTFARELTSWERLAKLARWHVSAGHLRQACFESCVHHQNVSIDM